jgi:hypothetical protein
MNRRTVITLFAALTMFLFAGINLVSDTEAGETVAVAGCSGSVAANCSGSSEPALLVARWTPVRNLFTRAKLRRAARRGCGGYSAAPASNCSAPQAVPTQECDPVQMVQPVQVITVAPVRLFRGCLNGQCR